VFRLRRLKDVVKATEELNELIESVHKWLLDTDEISRVVFQSPDKQEILKHLMQQEVTVAYGDD